MSKVDRPYSPSAQIPELEAEQPMGIKTRVLSTLLHPQLYTRYTSVTYNCYLLLAALSLVSSC